jgi:hypothetical protein
MSKSKASKYIDSIDEVDGEVIFYLKCPYELQGYNTADFSECVDDYESYEDLYEYAYRFIIDNVHKVDTKVWMHGSNV